MTTPHDGLRNALADVAGLRVGHHSKTGDGYLTGTTVVLAPDGGMSAGVDVRGGGPGTRETDLLSPYATVDRVHALVLTGGSAYGLASASGVADALGEAGVGLPVGPGPGEVVPIVPAAVVFDLGRGGDFGARPDAAFGRAAVEAAQRATADEMAACGVIGAGTGTVAGGLKGGIGQASTRLPSGTVVAALMVVNAAGRTVDPRTGQLYAAPFLTDADCPLRGAPTDEEIQALAAASTPSSLQTPSVGHSVRNTIIGVIATDASLNKAQCGKLAAMGHDGLARAVNPIHTLFDGDTIFAAATGRAAEPDLAELYQLHDAAATVVSRAVGRAILSASEVVTSAGRWPGYRDLVPSLWPGHGRDDAVRQ